MTLVSSHWAPMSFQLTLTSSDTTLGLGRAVQASTWCLRPVCSRFTDQLMVAAFDLTLCSGDSCQVWVAAWAANVFQPHG